ncbi:MAG: isopeptide-forming domain-containing fimbrial protein [Oscillospiraceae bacterium]|nr:isopeptide-forming domain-containing fimbrial protein [Oscillospiraceae bacterium]
MKKLISLTLVAALVLALSVTALADKNDSITVTNAKEGETYEIYKMFDLTVNNEEEPTAYSYTVNSAWADFFKAPVEGDPGEEAGPGYQYVTINNEGYVTEISDAAALAKEAAAWTGKPAHTDSATVGAGATTAVFSGLEDGYWLITSTLGTFAMAATTPDNENVTINEKNPEDTITKQVKEDSSGSYSSGNDAQIGDTLEFKSVVSIVKGTRNVVVHDEMDNGLTYTPGSVAIDGLTEGTEYTLNEAPTDGHAFDITFTQSWIDGLDFGEAGYVEYEITYKAVLNENAVNVDGNTVTLVDVKNKTQVSFGNGAVSTAATTTTDTHKFNVFKHATGETANLPGAVFSLLKGTGEGQTVVKLIKLNDTNYRVANGNEDGAVETFTTVAAGDIVIWGVDADDDYALHEVSPPTGYNTLPTDKEVTVASGDNTRVDIENKSGSELPSTGGMGTKIFYVIGAVLVIGAGGLLISRKRAGE